MNIAQLLAAAGYRKEDDNVCTFAVAEIVTKMVNGAIYTDEPFGDPKRIGGGVVALKVRPQPGVTVLAGSVFISDARIVPADGIDLTKKADYLLAFKNGVLYSAGGVADPIATGVTLAPIPLDDTGKTQAQRDLDDDNNNASSEDQTAGVIRRVMRSLFEYVETEGKRLAPPTPAPDPHHH